MAEQHTITIVIDEEVDNELTALATETGQSKSDLAREALIDWLEEQEDLREAERIVDENHPTVSFEEMKARLGLDR
jgi:predicted DNA-binding protein